MKAKREKGRGPTLREWLDEEMKDPEFRRGFELAGIEMRVALQITRAREKAGLSQKKLAAALKTSQQTVSRIETGGQNLTLETLDKIARALHRQLEVRLA